MIVSGVEIAPLRTLLAQHYLSPMRQGSSLPALVEADDGLGSVSTRYVVKLAGAGQGPKALIAELVAGEIARALGLPMPELVFVEFSSAFGRYEPDYEIDQLLKASVGLNLGMRYLDHALTFNPLVEPGPNPFLASCIVWFDAFMTNVDRTPRNVNLLIWQKALWLIDHGATLYFHHSWRDYMAKSNTPFTMIKDHTLLPFATELGEADEILRQMINEDLIHAIIDHIPDAWLCLDTIFETPAANRQAYKDYLDSRLQASPIFLEEALHAHAACV